MSLVKYLITNRTRALLYPTVVLINPNRTNITSKSIVPIKTASTVRTRSLWSWNYLLLFTTGCLTYKYLKDHSFIPTVSATSLFSGLAGRRKQFSFIAEVVEESAPAVVYIEIKDPRRVEFFSGEPLTVSNGSGFIIKEDGLILTNAHVVTHRPGAHVIVRMIDGATYKGVVEDIDMKSDLATIRIPAKNLPYIKLGDSSDLKPGEFVVAIGSPLSLSNTVTFGVVSSAHRASHELGIRDKDIEYIQTDAAITFGNSGGPLVNLNGEAIGINSMKVTAGISFAIPSDYVKEFLKNSQGANKPSKTRNRRYMGITMLTLTNQLLMELQQRNKALPGEIKSGVLVWKVIIGSPAYQGGLQPGDIVTHIDDKPIKTADDVYGILSENKSRKLKMSVNRYGNKMDLYVTPEDAQ